MIKTEVCVSTTAPDTTGKDAPRGTAETSARPSSAPAEGLCATAAGAGAAGAEPLGLSLTGVALFLPPGARLGGTPSPALSARRGDEWKRASLSRSTQRTSRHTYGRASPARGHSTRSGR